MSKTDEKEDRTRRSHFLSALIYLQIWSVILSGWKTIHNEQEKKKNKVKAKEEVYNDEEQGKQNNALISNKKEYEDKNYGKYLIILNSKQ